MTTRYRKITTVEASVATEAGTIDTLEGVHSYEAGDYICGPGAAGEFWPVKRAIFEATYVPVEAEAASGSGLRALRELSGGGDTGTVARPAGGWRPPMESARPRWALNAGREVTFDGRPVFLVTRAVYGEDYGEDYDLTPPATLDRLTRDIVAALNAGGIEA